MLKFLELFFALLEALPILEKYFQQIAIEYATKQKEKNNVEFLKALSKATKEKSTIDIAASIGKHLD